MTLRPPVCAVDPRRILDVMGGTQGAHVSWLESLSRKRCIMSSMRHESDLALREDSLAWVTTGLVQLCKSAVKQTLGMCDEKVYDFSVSIERGRYQMVGRPGAPQLDLFTYGLGSGVVSWFDAHVHGRTPSSSASQLLINIGGQLTLAITGFMLLVFMTTHSFQFHGCVCSAR